MMWGRVLLFVGWSIAVSVASRWCADAPSVRGRAHGYWVTVVAAFFFAAVVIAFVLVASFNHSQG